MQLRVPSHDSYAIVGRKERKMVQPTVGYAIHCAGLSREHSSLHQSPFSSAEEEEKTEITESVGGSQVVLLVIVTLLGKSSQRGGGGEGETTQISSCSCGAMCRAFR